ncbi:DUF5309 family protein [uncultured Muribaculum sp.]|uniref:SU10 major capsid protein n=1 Tax=uncultured Muribaculum sp. TaxID=1918613 RepID=UPI0026755680|nr:DUF5309 family protein [uncultured Muribaculum sp.]
MEPVITNGTTGAKHVSSSPLTLQITQQEASDLLMSDIDSRLVKVRPMATPVDQISRQGGARQCKSMEVDYYSVDSLPRETVITADKAASENETGVVSVENGKIFAPSDTLMALITDASGNQVTDCAAPVFYVDDVSADRLTLRVVNPVPDENDNIFPLLAKGTKLIRMGRAAAELDVQTSQSQVLPKKTRNYCQIFKAQVEQSVLHRLAAKEVGITLSDQEEMALMDMRLGIEKSFLFGAMARIDKGAQRGDVFLTQGIWPQAGQQFEYKRELFTQNTLVEMARMAFTGNAGSSRKVLVAGSGLIETISKLSHTKVLQGMQTTTRWGLDFREIITNFGRLYVILSEVFDLCGHPDDGMVIDPEYIQKYVHIPFKATPLDLRSSGQRNCDAMVLTEASCLVLRYPNAHMRIVRKPA